MNEFADKTILVTGASSGVGREVAIALSKKGARVVLVARDSERMDRTIHEMDNPAMHIAISFDLLRLDEYHEIFNTLKEKKIKLNGLVHCAGIAPVIPLRISNYQNSIDVFKLHYFSFVELAKFYSKKAYSEGGSIVAVSAISAHVPQKCMTAYSSSKAAVEAACRSLAIELVDKNIRINSVVLGGVNTSITANSNTSISNVTSTYENPVQRQLLGIAEPKQVVGPILFLLSDESGFITGRELYVDGGLL